MVLLIAVSIIIAMLLYFGILHFNNPSFEQYPVQGVDVSSYQGIIDWNMLSQQNISFAFIKATEGSTFVDERFQYNWDEAVKTDLWVGAYHFFSFESEGTKQAEHFILTVGSLDHCLPPVIDIEYYDIESDMSFSKEKIKHEIKDFVQIIKDYYGVYPILYVTQKTYNDLIRDNIVDCPLWVRSVYCKPKFIENNNWTFWQYSNRHKLSGYKGIEKYIDINAYNGNMDEFQTQFSLEIRER